MNAPSQHVVALPQYRSHKIVGAAKIVAIDHGSRLDLMPHGVAEVGPDWIREKRAEVGGYFVAYEDGYTSYSPAKAFEEGYRRVDTPIGTSAAYATVAAATAAFLPAQALLEGRNLLAHPEMMFNEGTARRVIGGLVDAIDSNRCFAKAIANGEEVFVLRSIDKAAPSAIHAWAALAMQEGAREEKVNDAIATAERWEELPHRKWPD